MRIEVEVVNNQEDLEPGDIVIYGSSKGLLTAKVEKKPARNPKYPSYFKSTRCKVNAEKHFQVYPASGHRINPRTITWTVQHFNIEEFNIVKYINFSGKSNILRVKQYEL